MQHFVGHRLLLSACALIYAGCNLDLPVIAEPPAPDGSTPYPMDIDAGPTGPIIDSGRDAAVPDAEVDASDASDAELSGCGDGKWQAGEACDDGNSLGGDGCSADCTQVEKDFVCPGPGESCVFTVVCGDGRIAGPETCDDGNERDDDGCSAKCAIEPGYVCLTQGHPCSAAECGDGVVAGEERCDDGGDSSGDGCSELCEVEAGYACPNANEACHKTVCNDGVKEGDEPCDDGNSVVGDGCTPFCEVEPDCSAGDCHSRCGDGLSLPSDDEECDDGNTLDHDGCSSTCKIEQGYSCSIETSQLPDVLEVPVTYRDFIAIPNTADPRNPTRHPDFEIFAGQGITPGLVASTLSASGKPQYTGICDDTEQPYPAPACPYGQQMTTQESFDQWYNDDASVNATKVERMQLMRDMSTGIYRIQNSAFYPWDGDSRSLIRQGLELTHTTDTASHNYGFTSEVRTYFEYKPDATTPQELNFAGDDDVWVFINHKLAVDIGGLHSQQTGSVTLNDATATQLGLEAGKIYEIVLFHAERHTAGSNFNLSLDGFVSARTHCESTCGDGVMVGRELCDDGKNDGSYGSCTADCTLGPFCGDGIKQSPQEACDDGHNLTTYSTDGKPACAPGCGLSAYCGDGQVDGLAGEECDDAEDNSGNYGHCTANCKLGPRCGDGVLQEDEGERCDDGNLISGDSCSSTCQFEGPQ